MFFGYSGVFGAWSGESPGDMAVGEPGLGTMGVPEVDGRSFEIEVVELLKQWVV